MQHINYLRKLNLNVKDERKNQKIKNKSQITGSNLLYLKSNFNF
jgi:hypothetical protein